MNQGFAGCIWVYGPKQYIHFERNYFERHYCNGGIYWLAFINVTVHLALIALGLLLLSCLLCSGLVKENRPRQQEQ
ncbi:unnamed protein product [Gongylonema pulchrum]|uniref:7TM_GPCR_Srx domain-containing protein n=1 Tax=Gongylonema pulchrum TaxID=637853 RepID=A0A183DEU9_9BILA|nr:unnamed protein product [Gongylonema pulchrum]